MCWSMLKKTVNKGVGGVMLTDDSASLWVDTLHRDFINWAYFPGNRVGFLSMCEVAQGQEI